MIKKSKKILKVLIQYYYVGDIIQSDANITELVEGDENSSTFYLLQTDQLVTKIDES